MSDDKKEEETTAAFKYTAPTDKKCFNTVKMFTKAECKDADAAKEAKMTDGVVETVVTLTAEDKSTSNWGIQTCDGKSIVLWPEVQDANKKYDHAATIKDDNPKKAEAVTLAVETQAKKDGTSGCVEVVKGALWATMKVDGYAKDGDSSSGAKTLGAAFAAGALAVAATQF